MSTTREMILFRFSMSTYCLKLMLAALSHDCDNKHTVESRDYAPPFCMLALVKSGEGAYTRDRDISA